MALAVLTMTSCRSGSAIGTMVNLLNVPCGYPRYRFPSSRCPWLYLTRTATQARCLLGRSLSIHTVMRSRNL